MPALERGFARVLGELERLDPDADFVDWPLRAAYTGVWRVFPLFFPEKAYLPVDVERNRARCPETASLLCSSETLEGAGFSLLGPRSHVLLHRDHYAPGVLRCHLALRVPPGAHMLFCGQRVAWQPGRCVVFDGQEEHEAVNPSAEPRIVLLANFRGVT